MLPKIYHAWVRLDEEQARSLSSWYKERHGPEVIAHGFLGVHHSFSVLYPGTVSNLYEITGTGIFDAEYKANQDADPYQKGTVQRVGREGSSQTIYSVLATANVPEPALTSAGPSLSGAMTSPVLSAVRFGTGGTATTDEVVSWFRTAEAPRLAALEGFVKARLALRDEVQHPHPSYPLQPREWLVLSEWGSVAHATAPENARLPEETMPGTGHDWDFDVVHQQLCLFRPDAWDA